MINMQELKPDTFMTLEELCAERDWPDIRGWMEPEHVALLTFRLAWVPDSAGAFPRGKWATIQTLQSMVTRFVQKEGSEKDGIG